MCNLNSDPKTLPAIMAFAFANNLHQATDGELEAWSGAEGTVYIAEDLTRTVVIDITDKGIGIEVHVWDEDEDGMTGVPNTAMQLVPGTLPLLG